jgi:pimeloyl-ACP methyl ester carboxylesterase
MRTLHYWLILLLGSVLSTALTEAQMQRESDEAAATAREGYAEVNGVRLHYVQAGKGPLILFLHGFPEFWYAWKDLLPEFAKDHTAVALDMRGYNLSSMPDIVNAYQIPILVEDIRALAEKLCAKRFVLVGHDWGGVIAWEFAAAHPEMLEKLVIINAPHPAVFARELANNPEQQKASAYFNFFNSPLAEAALSQNDYAGLQQIVFGTWTKDEDRNKYLESWKRGLTGGLNYYRAAGLKSPVGGERTDMSHFPVPKNAITVPTLVIWGEADTALLSSNLDGLDEYVKVLQIKRVPKAGHWIVHQQPVTVIQSMRRFLQ